MAVNVFQRTSVFAEWLDALADWRGRARIVARVEAAKSGNFGDCEPVGDGVSEMRVDFGPGYRIYFMREAAACYLLLCGGDKSTQRADIARAHRMARQVRQAAASVRQTSGGTSGPARKASAKVKGKGKKT